MLKTLRQIVQEVNRARDLTEALSIIVMRVKKELNGDVCSIYLMDKNHQQLVLMASDGLSPESIGNVRLGLDEGLVGFVADRAELINLANAPKHERYRYFPETGEEKYNAFLGVPIIHHRQVLGVLILQQRSKSRYKEDIETFMMTIAAQLAGAIAHAEISGGLTAKRKTAQFERKPLRGLAGSPGIAIGKAVVREGGRDLEMVSNRDVTDIKSEVKSFKSALSEVKRGLKKMQKNLDGMIPESDKALFDAYVMMLDGGSISKAIIERIHSGLWAPAAIREVVMSHVEVFRSMEDPYLQERANDIYDLGNRLLNQFIDKRKEKEPLPRNTILIANEVTPSMLAEVSAKRLKGIVSVKGSGTSHTAILARALNIPAVMGVDDLPIQMISGLDLIVDGHNGEVHIKPTRMVRQEFRELQLKEEQQFSELLEIKDQPAITKDGVKINLLVNTGLMTDINPSANSGAEGVGLYRTEYPFMMRDRFPGEDEQYKVYCRVLKSFSPHPVTMRTLDIGGDKALPYFPIEEDNPFLGWRGIRFTLDHPEIFLTQVRAMLRAHAEYGNLKILLPMISDTNELDDAIAVIQQAYRELIDDGFKVAYPEIGVMIEVPSALYQLDAIAEKVHFLSVGSNDLTQYLLAVDRNNPRVAQLYNSLHPAVLHALRMVADAGKKHKIDVSVCGEMAGNPVAVFILMGMGIHNFSMNASSIPRIKWMILNSEYKQAELNKENVLASRTADEISSMIKEQFDSQVIEKLYSV